MGQTHGSPSWEEAALAGISSGSPVLLRYGLDEGGKRATDQRVTATPPRTGRPRFGQAVGLIEKFELAVCVGDTLLHMAARSAQEEIVAILVDYGADLTIKNAAGETPAMVASNERVRRVLVGMSDPAPATVECKQVAVAVTARLVDELQRSKRVAAGQVVDAPTAADPSH